MLERLYFVLRSGVPVQAGYSLNTAACANMSNNFIDCVFRLDITAFSLLGFGHV